MRELETDRSLLQIAKDHSWTVRDVLSYRTGASTDTLVVSALRKEGMTKQWAKDNHISESDMCAHLIDCFDDIADLRILRKVEGVVVRAILKLLTGETLYMQLPVCDDNDYMCLEKRISYLEKYILEAKQVGTLYHVCSLESYYRYILPNDVLKSSGEYDNYLYKGNDYVSFTRNKSFIVDTVIDYGIIVQLVIDGDKLSDHYKIGPYNDMAYDSEGSPNYADDDPKNREQEEAVKGPIRNISKYIKSVQIDILKLPTEGELAMLEKVAKKNPKIEYFNFIRGNANAKKILFKKEPTNGMSIAQFFEILDTDDLITKKLFSGIVPNIKNVLEENRLAVNAYFKGYGYPLHYYCEKGNEPVVYMLLSYGADPNRVDMHGNTALIATIKGSSPTRLSSSIIKVILGESDADVNKRGGSKAGRITPLMAAVQAGSVLIAETLLKHGANPRLKDSEGRTVFDMTDDAEMLNLLNKYRK